MTKSNFTTSVILLIIAISLLVFAVTKDKSNDRTNEVINNIQETLSPYSSKNKLHKEEIVSNFNNTVILKDNAPTAKIQKQLVVKGTIIKGYLYIVASADDRSLKTSDPNRFDDIYVNLIELGRGSAQANEYGGHLIANRSLDTPKSEEKTELLFSLADVPYLKTYTDLNKEITSGNWLEILNGDSSKKMVAFSSTLKKGVIQELSVYYECLENSECSITAE